MSLPETPDPMAEPGNPKDDGFNPLRTWDDLVAELGDPCQPGAGSYLGIPEEELER